MIAAVVVRDLRLAFRAGADLALALLFFAAVVLLFGLSLGHDAPRLAAAAPAVMWSGALLAALLTVENIFHRDIADGTFHALAACRPPAVVMLAKTLSHWLQSGLPLCLAALVFAPMLGVGARVALFLPAGTLYCSALAAFAAALTAGSRNQAALLVFLVVPLFVPMLLAGLGATAAFAGGLPWRGYALLQLALLLPALFLFPVASAAFLTMRSR